LLDYLDVETEEARHGPPRPVLGALGSRLQLQRNDKGRAPLEPAAVRIVVEWTLVQPCNNTTNNACSKHTSLSASSTMQSFILKVNMATTHSKAANTRNHNEMDTKQARAFTSC
jgi:hypothetical protein